MMTWSANVRTLCRAIIVVAALLAGVACAGDDVGPGSDSTSGNPPVRSRYSRSEDLTGDGRAERFVVTAEGPNHDSLAVRLEIRSPDDSLLYASTWDSRFYFQYDDRGAMTDSAAALKVRTHLGRILVDSAFAVGGRGITSDTIRLAMMRDAIRYDLATHQLRRQHQLAPGEPLPPAAHDSINVLARAVPPARIASLVTELQDRKSFRYFAGGEVTYSIAWSDQEQRFVTIFSCC